MASRFILNPVSYHGYGALDSIKEVVEDRKLKKIVVFVDKFLKDNKISDKVTDRLDKMENVSYTYFTDIKPNPSITNVLDGLKKLKDFDADGIIAIGGGSVMDCAAGAAIIKENPEFEDVRSLEGTAATKNYATPIIAIPTTAGTAAEVTINYVITDEENQKKMVCVDPHSIPVAAIVDPEMMESMPYGLTAATGMDALTHAIEGYITKDANELSDTFHLKSIELIANSLKKACENDKDAREQMALAQYVAGMGFSNVGLGLVHSMAHPLGALYDTPHGVANAILLPTVMEYNAEETGEKYREIARVMGVKDVDKMSQDEYRKAAVDAVKDLSKAVDIPEDLKDIVKKEDIDFLAQSAMDDACRPGNPKDPTKEEVIGLYEKLI